MAIGYEYPDQCPPGQHYDNGSSSCVDDNPPPDDDTQTPSTCPPGTVPNDGTNPLFTGDCRPDGENANPNNDKPQDEFNWEDWPTYNGPNMPTFDFGPAPRFVAPQFNAPTLEEAQNEPGYALAAQEGRKSLEQSAAARGMLRSGGTLKDIYAWGNKFAEQNYGNVFNRALSAFDRLYQGKLAEYSPLLVEWQTNAAGKQRAGELSFDRAWQQYLAELERYKWMHPSASDIFNAEWNG